MKINLLLLTVAALFASTALAQTVSHTVQLGPGSMGGNAGDFNTGAGFSAGESSTGSYGTYVGQGAGNSTKDDFGVYVGAGNGIFASGLGRTSLGSVAGRLSNAPFAVSIGFASGQGADGINLVHIGNHAGSPTPEAFRLSAPRFDPATSLMITGAPRGYAPTVGRPYRLQFRNGGGRAPGGLVDISVIARPQSVSRTNVTWLLDAKGTDAGSGDYVVGLAYSDWHDDIVVGDGNSDGSGQIRLGFEKTAELLPSVSGTVSLGRSPDEAKTAGTEGVKKWRGVTSRYAGVYANDSEPAWFDFGLNDVRRWQWRADPATGDLSLSGFGSDGQKLSTPIMIENATGRVKMVLPLANDNAAARHAGLTVSTAYRTPAGAVMVVF